MYEEFRDRFVARSAQIRVGDGFDPQVDMGPVSSRTQYDKVLSYLAPDRLSGTVLCGGGPYSGDGLADGYYIAPTVIDRPAPESPTVQEEIFGPVVGLLGVNVPTSVGDMAVPGGGRKNSGRGEYEGAGDGIVFFTHLKPVFYRR